MTGRSAHEEAPCRLRARYFLQEKVETNVRHIVRGRKISISDAIVRLHRARLSAVSVPSNRAFKGEGEEISPWSDNGSSPPRPTKLAPQPPLTFSFLSRLLLALFSIFSDIFSLGAFIASYFIHKGSKNQLAVKGKEFRRHNMPKKERRKLFVLDNFQGYEDFPSRAAFLSAPTYTARKTCGCLEKREGKVIFFIFCG